MSAVCTQTESALWKIHTNTHTRAQPLSNFCFSPLLLLSPHGIYILKTFVHEFLRRFCFVAKPKGDKTKQNRKNTTILMSCSPQTIFCALIKLRGNCILSKRWQKQWRDGRAAAISHKWHSAYAFMCIFRLYIFFSFLSLHNKTLFLFVNNNFRGEMA